jgi:hypothetical protein
MKKQIFFLGISILLQGGVFSSAAEDIPVQEFLKVSEVIKKIQHSHRPPKTLAFQYQLEQERNEKKSIFMKEVIFMNNEEKSYAWRNVQVIPYEEDKQITSENFINKEILVTLTRESLIAGEVNFTNKFITSGEVSLRKSPTTNFFMLRLPVDFLKSLRTGKNILEEISEKEKLKSLGFETRNGKEFLRYSEELSDYLFEIKTGLLVQKTIYSLDDNKKKIPVIEFNFEEYLDINGWNVPVKFTRKEPRTGTRYTYLVNKDSVAVNMPIPSSVFIPKFPVGAEVHNEITGKSYVVNSLGGASNEQILAKELDKIFEEDKK